MRATVTLLARRPRVAAHCLSGPPPGHRPAARIIHPATFLVDLQTWWDITVDGFEDDGIPVYVGGNPRTGSRTSSTSSPPLPGSVTGRASSTSFGVRSGRPTTKAVTAGAWHEKRRPITPGNPAYFFNGVDEHVSRLT